MRDFRHRERPRVLIVALSGMGNLLMASPLIRALKDQNATVEIDAVVAPRGTADILEGNPRIRAVLRGKAKPSLRDWLRLMWRLRRERYDVGIITHPGQLILSASLLAFGGVPQRLGYRYSWAFLKNTGAFLTHPLPLRPHRALALHDRTAHDVVQNLRLLEPLGVHVSLESHTEVGYEFPLTTDDRRRADAWLAAHGLGRDTLIGIHPGAYGDLASKRWPAERFAALGDRLAEHYGAAVLVFGGPEEHALKTEVCARATARAIAADTPLRTTAALIARCALFVSNDSGLMHVAVSQNVETFGIFGPTDERRTAPWRPRGHVLRSPGTQPTYDVKNLRRVRAQRAPDPSLLALSVEEVFRKITATLARSA